MFTIENQLIRVSIHPRGAELQSIFHKTHDIEYMWSGDPAFWGKHSPLLFPIVGTLKGNTYYYQDKPYSLSRHGFAREREFAVESQSSDCITLLLKSDADSKAVYPFDFELRVIYKLLASGLTTTYRVDNPAADPLYFSVGGHPAFKIPIVPGTTYTDYYLQFNQSENAPRWPISNDGLIETQPQPLLDNASTISLKKELFANDALVFKHPASSAVAIRSSKTERGVKLDFPGFPYLGIWAAPNADFVCLEPWCGIADSVDSDQQFTKKEGINVLAEGEEFERTWMLTVL